MTDVTLFNHISESTNPSLQTTTFGTALKMLGCDRTSLVKYCKLHPEAVALNTRPHGSKLLYTHELVAGGCIHDAYEAGKLKAGIIALTQSRKEIEEEIESETRDLEDALSPEERLCAVELGARIAALDEAYLQEEIARRIESGEQEVYEAKYQYTYGEKPQPVAEPEYDLMVQAQEPVECGPEPTFDLEITPSGACVIRGLTLEQIRSISCR